LHCLNRHPKKQTFASGGIGLEFHPRNGRKVASPENTERSIAPVTDENTINS
jgi:hypothetical protein